MTNEGVFAVFQTVWIICDMVGDKNKISERLVWFSNTGQGRVSEVFGNSLPLMVVGVLYYVPIRMI